MNRQEIIKAKKVLKEVLQKHEKTKVEAEKKIRPIKRELKKFDDMLDELNRIKIF